MSIKDEVHDAARKYAAAPYAGWRSRIKDYTPIIGSDKAETLEKVRDIVYGIVLDTGADLKTLCDYFGWDRTTAKNVVGPVVDMAKAELKLAVQKNQLDFAMSCKQPLAKIHVGRQFADQTESGQPVPDSSASVTDGLFNGLTVVETHRDSNGTTVQEPSKLKLVKSG